LPDNLQIAHFIFAWKPAIFRLESTLELPYCQEIVGAGLTVSAH
jgi:hypothetical protein